MKVVRALGRWLSYVIPPLMLIAAVVILLPILLGMNAYAITSGSMVPTIPVGALIYDEAVPTDTLELGDVITYKPPPDADVDKLVTHRIVWKGVDAQGRTAYQTRGDANDSADPWKFTLDEEEQPRYRFHYPYLGYVLGFLQRPLGRFLILILPAALIFLAVLIEIIRAARRPVRRVPAGAAAGATLVLGLVMLTSIAAAKFEQTATSTIKVTAAAVTPTPASLVGRYRNNTASPPDDNAITPWLQIVNRGASQVDLGTVTMRYWFTKSGLPATATLNSFCDYAYLGCSPSGPVTHRIGSVSPARPLADAYLEIGFASGTKLAAGGSTNDIQLRIHDSGYQCCFRESDDYSFAPTQTDFQDWPKVTVYSDGKLVWGTEP